MGRSGEINAVLGIANCYPQGRQLWRINGSTHVTTDEHTHVGPTGFYAVDRAWQAQDWGKAHWMGTSPGHYERVMHHGLNPKRMSDLEVGVVLQTLDGPVVVQTIELVPAHDRTLLWNLMIGGSHTMFVDGYCVTGWPREDDWDWDAWKPVA